MSPPIVYKGSETDIWFNPKNVMHFNMDIPDDELPFINLKIGETHVDLEGRANETTFIANRRNRIRATVTD